MITEEMIRKARKKLDDAELRGPRMIFLTQLMARELCVSRRIKFEPDKNGIIKIDSDLSVLVDGY